tara:strand:+ start:1244 stop:2008 length:765 start_codon:yes stop_codon:yes gene_type:complete
MQDNLDMLYLVGNGPSRKNIDPNTLSEWWGMNMIYRTHSPDMVFVQDVSPQNECVKEEYYKKGKVCFAEWNELPIDMWDMMKLGLPGTIIETRLPDDDAFVYQGETSYEFGEETRSYMIGYNRAYADNIVIYKNELLKNMYCGIYALGYAVHHGYKNICLVGYDSLQFNESANVYGREDHYTYADEYRHDSGVLDIQQSQFVSLMEHINKEYPEIKVYFKNPIEGFDLIVYNELLSRFKVEDKWILGQGLESLI